LRIAPDGDLISPVASFYDFALVCQALSQTQSRNQLAELAAEFLARLDPEELQVAARFMVGRALAIGEEKRVNVSGRAIWRIAAELAGGVEDGEEIFAGAEDFGEAVEILMRRRAAEPEPALTLAEVNQNFAEIALIEGRHSRQRKLERLRDLFARASSVEAKFLAKILIGEMRHGMNEGLMVEAIARMAGRPVAEIRRLFMMEGDVGRVALLASTGQSAAAGLQHAAQKPAAKPLKSMLAQPVRDLADVFAILGKRFALEHKLDGARVQLHCIPGGVRIFSRRLNDITPSLPEVERLVERLKARNVILDGEVIAVDAENRPLAFQELMHRFGRVRDIEEKILEQPVRLYLFDILALDGELLIDRPYEERYLALSALAAQYDLELATRLLPSSLSEAEQFFEAALAAGYEGVMAKSLDGLYVPGVRGRGWLKVKRARTLDLVITAADWGYGRRHGWLSNYHLAARDPQSGGFVKVGKTFKGLTDAEFEEMTEKLLALKIQETAGTVIVEPKVVVEVAYNDLQRSPRYAGGIALRFARIVRRRDDKGPDEADTLETLLAEFDRQIVKPLPAKVFRA
jgi:DNA ligase 1